eukprot:gene7865-9682_t
MYALNCWVCFNFYTEPITLYCSHSFCKECLIKSANIECLCPYCRQEFSLPLPPINKSLDKKIRKLRGEDVSDDEIENNNNYNNNNNFYQPQPQPQPEPEPQPMVIDDNKGPARYLAADLLHLPNLVYSEIFYNLSIKEILDLSLVCKDLTKPTNDPCCHFASPDKYDFDYKKCFQVYKKGEKNFEKGAAGTFKMTALRGHTAQITSIDYLGNTLSTASINDSTVKIWNLTKGKLAHDLKPHDDHRINGIKQLETTLTTCGNDGTIKIFDLETSNQLQSLILSNENVLSVSYNPMDYNQIHGTTEVEVGLWDSKSQKNIMTLRDSLRSKVLGSQFDQKGGLLVNTESGLSRFDLRKTDQPLYTVGSRQSTFYQPTLDYLYSYVINGLNRTLSKYNINDGSVVKTTSSIPNISCMKATNNEVAIGVLNDIQLLDSNLNLSKTLSNHTQNVTSIIMDDKKVISSSADNTIKVWDQKSGKRLYSLLGGSIQVRNGFVPGCQEVRSDQSRVVGIFNDLVRVYNFKME